MHVPLSPLPYPIPHNSCRLRLREFKPIAGGYRSAFCDSYRCEPFTSAEDKKAVERLLEQLNKLKALQKTTLENDLSIMSKVEGKEITLPVRMEVALDYRLTCKLIIQSAINAVEPLLKKF